jgi:hypothetical protein
VQKKKSLQMLPLFSQKKYMSHRIYREGGTKFYLIRSPCSCLHGVLSLAMQALLVTLIELFLNYKPSAGRGEPGTWVTRQTTKSK